MDVNPDAYLLETNAARMTQHGPPRREPRGAYDPTGESRGQFHLLPRHRDQRDARTAELLDRPIVPRDVRRRTGFSTTSSPRTPTTWIEESLAFDAQVGAEDRRLIERVQAGMGAGFIEDGRLLPESEQLIAHFQALVVDALA